MNVADILLAYDDDRIKPGWVAFWIVLALAVATFLLWRSMNSQLRKINVPPRGAGPGDVSASPDDHQDDERGNSSDAPPANGPDSPDSTPPRPEKT
jgi:hypothetical protein